MQNCDVLNGVDKVLDSHDIGKQKHQKPEKHYVRLNAETFSFTVIQTCWLLRDPDLVDVSLDNVLHINDPILDDRVP